MKTRERNITMRLRVKSKIVLVSLALVLSVQFSLNAASSNEKDMLTAARAGDLAQVTQMVEGGADVNYQDSHLWTALMGAAGSGHQEIVEYLIEHGATVSICNDNGWTALMWAAHRPQRVMDRMLGKEIVIDAHLEIIHLAAQNGDIEMVKLLVQAGADILAVNAEEGMSTPLFAAHENNQTDVVNYLLSLHEKRTPGVTQKFKSEYLGEEAPSGVAEDSGWCTVS